MATEYQRERERRYREAHREHILERIRRYREAHLEQAHESSKRYYKANKDKCNKYNSAWQRGLKIEVLSHYNGGGYPKCSTCGESRIDCLSIDHIDGGGEKHKRELGICGPVYNWLKKNDYPPGFQVLCMNCQFIKRAENNEYRR